MQSAPNATPYGCHRRRRVWRRALRRAIRWPRPRHSHLDVLRHTGKGEGLDTTEDGHAKGHCGHRRLHHSRRRVGLASSCCSTIAMKGALHTGEDIFLRRHCTYCITVATYYDSWVCIPQRTNNIPPATYCMPHATYHILRRQRLLLRLPLASVVSWRGRATRSPQRRR